MIYSALGHRPHNRQCDSKSWTARKVSRAYISLAPESRCARSRRISPPTPFLAHFFAPNVSACSSAQPNRIGLKSICSMRALPEMGASVSCDIVASNHLFGTHKRPDLTQQIVRFGGT